MRFRTIYKTFFLTAKLYREHSALKNNNTNPIKQRKKPQRTIAQISHIHFSLSQKLFIIFVRNSHITNCNTSWTRVLHNKCHNFLINLNWEQNFKAVSHVDISRCFPHTSPHTPTPLPTPAAPCHGATPALCARNALKCVNVEYTVAGAGAGDGAGAGTCPIESVSSTAHTPTATATPTPTPTAS